MWGVSMFVNNMFFAYFSCPLYILTSLRTKAVQHYLKQNDKRLLKNYDTKYPNTIEIFCRSKKGCRDMYNTLISNKKACPTSETKWNKAIEVTRHDWSNIYSLSFKCTKESKLHWFQFQLLHTIT